MKSHPGWLMLVLWLIPGGFQAQTLPFAGEEQFKILQVMDQNFAVDDLTKVELWDLFVSTYLKKSSSKEMVVMLKTAKERVSYYQNLLGNPQTLYLKAGKFQRERNSTQAERLYNYIIETFPDSAFAVKATDNLNTLKLQRDQTDAIEHAQKSAVQTEIEQAESAIRRAQGAAEQAARDQQRLN